jgi:hypothetical protein
MTEESNYYCHYSDLPSPNAYIEMEDKLSEKEFSTMDIDRVIEMAWEDRTTFDAIKIQFGLSENEVKAINYGENEQARVKLNMPKQEILP